MKTPIEMLNLVCQCRTCNAGNACRYCDYERRERECGENGPICLDILLGDVEDTLSRYVDTGAKIAPMVSLLDGFGHGWEEHWYIGDDEEPESITLEECVWINGHLMLGSGSDSDFHSDYWQDHYNKKYGTRIWIGDRAPTEEQRKAAEWDG